SKKNFAGGDAATSALDKVQEGPSAVKLAAVPVSERPAGWLLRPLGRLLELGCVFRRERFPLSRHVVQLLAVLRVAHLMRDFPARYPLRGRPRRGSRGRPGSSAAAFRRGWRRARSSRRRRSRTRRSPLRAWTRTSDPPSRPRGAFLRAFTPVFDGLWTRVNAL